MNRLLAVVAVSLFAVACGVDSAGRCTADSQCPVGASCDEKIGVCVAATSNTNSSTTTPPALPQNYGRYCENDSHCAGVPGTKCAYNECTASCANGAVCPGGTTCAGASGAWGCFQKCSSSATCANGAMCGMLKPSTGDAFLGCFPKYPSETGGTCTDDLGCDDSNVCATSATHPQGYCTKTCTGTSDCSWGDLCVVVSSTQAKGLCMPKCEAPNSTSTCVPGTTCHALSTASYGYCY